MGQTNIEFGENGRSLRGGEAEGDGGSEVAALGNGPMGSHTDTAGLNPNFGSKP